MAQAESLSTDALADQVAQRVMALEVRQRRQLIAIAGPPASGKSTLSDALCARLNAAGKQSAILPMDGFHLHNDILSAKGLLARKGAPESFDLAGFRSLVERLQIEPELYGPSFDRARDISLAASVHFGPEVGCVIVEGNYLLLDQPGWRDLARYWDLSVFIGAPVEELRRRLLARWEGQGLSAEAVEGKVAGNDLPNAELVMTRSRAPDLVL